MGKAPVGPVWDLDGKGGGGGHGLYGAVLWHGQGLHIYGDEEARVARKPGVPAAEGRDIGAGAGERRPARGGEGFCDLASRQGAHSGTPWFHSLRVPMPTLGRKRVP